jgi:hypothetical protein
MLRQVRGPLLLLCAGLAAAGVACGPAAPATSCPTNDLPATCPTPAPSYAGEVQAIFQAKCLPGCHEPGGMEATKPYTTLAQILQEPLQTMLIQVLSCNMPKAPSPGLTADERKAMLGWFECMRPNN